MLSVRDTAIATQKVSPEFEQCSCAVPLALPNTVLFVYDKVTDIRPRKTSGVVTTLTGNPPEFPTKKYILYSFLLQSQSTPDSQCGRNIYVNEKFH